LKRKQQDYKILQTEKAKTTTTTTTTTKANNTNNQEIEIMKNSAGTTTTSFAFDDDELRKLTMKQLGRILKSYGMTQKVVNGLTRRSDRVHVIRDFATKEEKEAAAVKRQRDIAAKEEEEQQYPVLRNHGNNHKNKHGATIYWFSVNAW